MLRSRSAINAPASRKSFLQRIVGVVFMRANSKCAHQVRPPRDRFGWAQPSVECLATSVVADKPARRSLVTAAAGWLVDQVSCLLDPDERAAVRGDITELGITSAQAVVEVLGLVVRRQAALWTEWGPWLALVGVAIPLGVLLGQLSWSWADGSAIYTFLYVNNWTWAYVESPGDSA